jgi:hypothetical protein
LDGWAFQSRNGEGHISWSHDGERVEVRYRGSIALTDDDRDIAQISPGGYFRISDGGWFGAGNRVEVRPLANGTLERKFSSGWSEKPFEPEGRQWLATALQRLIRRTGFAADARVSRILKAQGAPGVLAEISRLETSYARSVYFRKLFVQATLTDRELAQALEQAGRQVDGSYELSRVLRQAADQAVAGAESRKAYFDAAAKITSDYEAARALTAALSKPGLPSASVAQGLAAAKTIESDYELARLLRAVAGAQTLDAESRKAFFDALALVGSDYEHRRVLSAVAGGGGDPAVSTAALTSAAKIDSDYDLAQVLLGVVRAGKVEASRDEFFRAVSTLQSGYERRRVLAALADSTTLSNETLTALLTAARDTGSDYDLAQILLRVAARHKLEGGLRDAYLNAADQISSSYEQGRVLVALVKNERGR